MIGVAGEETLNEPSSRFSCGHIDLRSTIPSGLAISAFRLFQDTPEVANMCIRLLCILPKTYDP